MATLLDTMRACGVATLLMMSAAASAADTCTGPLPVTSAVTPDGALRVAGTPLANDWLAAVATHPSGHAPVKLALDLRGSQAAVAQLMFGTAALIVTDRPLSKTEQVPYKKLHCALPVGVPVARIALPTAPEQADKGDAPNGGQLYVYLPAGHAASTQSDAATLVADLLSADGQARLRGSPALRPLSAAEPRYVQPDGAIFIVGNDGMETLLDAFNARFATRHPEFRVRMRMEGSSTGGPALMAGVTPFAPMSRPLWRDDQAGFRQQFGYAPTEIRFGYAGYGPRKGAKTPPAMYMHASNPLTGMTTAQARRVFTRDPAGEIVDWGALGATGAWAHKAIHVYGLPDEGGSATSARDQYFAGQPYTVRYATRTTVHDVLDAVAHDPAGVGLVGWANTEQQPDIKLVKLAPTDGAPMVGPDKATVSAGRYPYSSSLRFYVNLAPGATLDPFIAAYMDMVLSDEGQAIVRAQQDDEGGYLPLSPADLAAQRAALVRMTRPAR